MQTPEMKSGGSIIPCEGFAPQVYPLGEQGDETWRRERTDLSDVFAIHRALAVCRQTTRLLHCASGVAAVELALLLPLMVVLLSALGNLGFALQAKVQINNALSATAYYAFEKGQGLTSSGAAAVDAGIRAAIASMLPQYGKFTTEIEYNGSQSQAEINYYYCVPGTAPVAFSRSGSTRSTCPDGLYSGKYIAIKLSGVIDPILPFDSLLGGYLTVSETVYVRIS